MKNPKKLAHLVVTVISLAALAMPVIASAQQTDVGNSQVPPPPPANTPPANGSGGLGRPNVIRQNIENVQNDYDSRIQNIERNRNVRNDAMEASSGPSDDNDGNGQRPPFRQPTDSDGSSTPGMMPRMMNGMPPGMGVDNSSSTRPIMHFPVTPLLRRFASSTVFASSTILERFNDDRGHEQQTRLDLFAWKQNMLVMELTRALDNLKQIRARIDTRIASDTTSGHDLSAASALLPAADTALTNAGDAITALAAYVPPSATSTDAEASTSVDLGAPRSIGSDAIKAVDLAKKALADVVNAIAVADKPATNAPTTTQ